MSTVYEQGWFVSMVSVSVMCMCAFYWIKYLMVAADNGTVGWATDKTVQCVTGGVRVVSTAYGS